MASEWGLRSYSYNLVSVSGQQAIGEALADMLSQAIQKAWLSLDPPLDSWKLASHDVAIYEHTVLVSFVFQQLKPE